MKRSAKILALIFLVSSMLVPQSAGKKVYHPFTGTLVYTVEGGATYGLTDYSTAQPDITGRSMLEYYFPFYSQSGFGIRLMGGMGYVKGKENIPANQFRTSVTYGGGSVIYTLSLSRVFFPYFAAGVSYVWISPKDGNGNAIVSSTGKSLKDNEINYNAELGFKFAVTDNLVFNIGAMGNLSPNDKLDGRIKGTNNDMFVSGFAGFSIAFFTKSDSDGDGIDDDLDLCQDTPSGLRIDEHGCPLDSDKDGVPDYQDQCPGTPEGVKVDKNGCPIDTDGDGVADYIDICPGTPRGIAVDEFGCPKDTDGDGVPDYLDQCLNTPKGVQVDKNGCPLDSDADGVPDYLDQCPNTPAGIQVDATGCPMKKEEVIKEVPVYKEIPVEKPIVLSAGASFAQGKAVLQSAAYPELDKLVKFMKENPKTNWIIEGHTDNKGSYEGNKKLSLERAQAVLKYFVSKGLVKSRFTVRGLGPDFPVADNNTEAGRTKNRRVVIMRVE